MREGIEKYTPPSKEVAKAEEMMTPERKTASEALERFKYQERDPFDDFIEHIDHNIERRPPTPEEKERMDTNLVKLGKIFEGSDIRWHIDGALNISLVKGEYIGVHKDVDISIEQGELERVDGQLERSGYGLFLSYPKDAKEPKGKKIMERVGAHEFSEAESKHLMISAIDEQGKIREGETLNFIDVHLIKRNEAGKPVGWGGVELPEKWFDAQPMTFKGQEVHLSHPAKVAYFKLHGTRTYDRTDLRALAETETLITDDMNEIEQTSEQEALARKRKAEILLGRVSDKLNSQMPADEIFNAFAKEPAIAKALEQIREPLKTLSQKIEASDKSKSEIMRLAFETFNLEASAEEQRKKIEELKRWIEDAPSHALVKKERDASLELKKEVPVEEKILGHALRLAEDLRSPEFQYSYAVYAWNRYVLEHDGIVNKKEEKPITKLTAEHLGSGLELLTTVINSMLKKVRERIVTAANLGEVKQKARQYESSRGIIYNEGVMMMTLANWFSHMQKEKMKLEDVDPKFLSDICDSIHDMMYKINQYGDVRQFVKDPSEFNDAANNLREVQKAIKFFIEKRRRKADVQK